MSKEEKYFEDANDWEAERTFLIEESERKAWLTAKASWVITGLSWLAIALMMPLKEKELAVVRVNAVTGQTDIVTTLKEEEITHDEAMDKSWLAQYVLARESYDWNTLQRDYDTVGLLSSQTVGKEYASLFDGDNAIDKKYGASVVVRTKVISAIPTGEGTGTVRFVQTIKRVGEIGEGVSKSWVATIAYEYNPKAAMTEDKRLINPWGFQVISYRTDPEVPEAKK